MIMLVAVVYVCETTDIPRGEVTTVYPLIIPFLYSSLGGSQLRTKRFENTSIAIRFSGGALGAVNG